MGFFDRFTKSFDDEVNEALEKVRNMGLGVEDLSAIVQDKIVTLKGRAPSMEIKSKVMEVFNQLVETDNTINLLEIPRKKETAPEPEPTPEEETLPAERFYEVVSGDTLGGIAKRFYGQAGKYMKIFEANRDILDDPNLIKVGQKLRIPE